MAFLTDYCELGKGAPNTGGIIRWTTSKNINHAIERLRNRNYDRLPSRSEEAYRVGEGYAWIRESNPRIRIKSGTKQGLAVIAVVDLDIPIDPVKIREFEGRVPEIND